MPQVGSNEERKFISHALDNNYVNEGELATEFEKKLTALMEVSHAIAVSNCTSAIFLALKGLGVGPGDEVIVPDITFIATANAVHLTGARPVLVDINPHDLNIDVAAIVAALSPRTKAIVPVHVTGRGADMSKIMELAAARGLFVVEDAAEALLSKHEGKYLGTFGQAGCFSFSPNKTITTGQGGIIVTNDTDLAVRVRSLKDQGRPMRGTGGDDRHDTIGYNFKFTDLQAALGLGQLTLLPERLVRMQRINEIYQQELATVPGIKIFIHLPGAIQQWTDAWVDNRDELVEHLKSQNIDCRKYWYPLHRQLAYQSADAGFTHSTSLSPHLLWLPSAFTLADDDVYAVCSAIKQFLV